MKISPCVYRFYDVCTSIGSYSEIPSTILEQILFIRKIAFIDRKKWDIESYHGGAYESDEYDDADAIYIYSHQGELVTGCVRLRPSSKPTLLSGALNFTLTVEKTRPNSLHCWEATRFALLPENSSSKKSTQANINARTAALFLSMIRFANQQKVRTYEVVIDVMMEKILRRSGWTVERRNIALGTKGEKIIYGTLACTPTVYEEVLKKNSTRGSPLYDDALTQSLMTY